MAGARPINQESNASGVFAEKDALAVSCEAGWRHGESRDAREWYGFSLQCTRGRFGRATAPLQYFYNDARTYKSCDMNLNMCDSP